MTTPLGPAVIRKPWTKQPPVGTPIDWSNPITQGLVNCWVFNAAAGLPQNMVMPGSIAVQGLTFTTNNGMTWGRDNYGAYLESNSTSDYIFTAESIDPDTEIPVGTSVWAFQPRIDNSQTLRRFWGWDTNSEVFCQLGSINRIDSDMFPGASNVFLDDADAFEFEQFNVQAATWNRSLGARDLYTDGMSKASASGDTPSSTTAVPFYLSARSGATTSGRQGRWYYYFMFNRVLSAIEIDALYRDPWQIFKPRTIYIPEPDELKLVQF